MTIYQFRLKYHRYSKIFYHPGVYASVVEQILKGRSVGSSFSIPEAKERTGLSRKYMIPLLVRMEADGYVRRNGDVRSVLRLPD